MGGGGEGVDQTPSTGLRHPWREVPESDARSVGVPMICVCVCRGGGGGGGGALRSQYDFLFLLFGSATMTRLQSVSSAMSADGSERRRRNFFSRLAAAMEGRRLESIPRQERQDFSFPDWSAVRADNFSTPSIPVLSQ